MKEKNRRWAAAVMVLALMLSLLMGCGADEPEEPPVPSPEQSQKAAPSQSADESEAPSKPDATATPVVEPTTEPTATLEPAPTPVPEPTPEPTSEPTPEPTQSGPEDGTYTASVTLSGGTGRAAVQSPATLRCTNGQFYATIVWSSPNYDYMKVNGVRYELISAAGENSAFEIPVAGFDQALPVIADTVAMSEPHEVEYTLTFSFASLTKQ